MTLPKLIEPFGTLTRAIFLATPLWWPCLLPQWVARAERKGQEMGWAEEKKEKEASAHSRGSPMVFAYALPETKRTGSFCAAAATETRGAPLCVLVQFVIKVKDLWGDNFRDSSYRLRPFSMKLGCTCDMHRMNLVLDIFFFHFSQRFRSSTKMKVSSARSSGIFFCFFFSLFDFFSFFFRSLSLLVSTARGHNWTSVERRDCWG